MISIIKKYKSIILYVIFGGFTTLINIGTYFVCTKLIRMDTIQSNVSAWILAVLFAYVTNRCWVFDSHVNSKKRIIHEIIGFFCSRLSTGILDLVIMFIAVDICGLNGIVIKVLSNILVIILNYIASKFLIFHK